MKKYFVDFISLVFPRCCISCKGVLNHSEEFFCLFCFEDLPRAHFINLENNTVEKVFDGRVELKSAASWLHFKKGNRSQVVLHELKYRNNPEIGFYLGRLIGMELSESRRFSNVDAIVPIPLHPSKLKRRGYNQSECLAEGISSILHAKVYSDLVVKTQKSKSQTTKNRLQRWENVVDIFKIESIPNEKIGHVLIVDDVITTGATIESITLKISSVLSAEISVVSLAYTE